MFPRLRLLLPPIVALHVLPAFAAQPVVRWEASLNHRLDAQSDKLPTGRAVMRFRYRGEPGDLVWATLLGASDPDGASDADRFPLKALVLEYDASGGRGEWKTAEGSKLSVAFKIRAPASGRVDFRVRATENVPEAFTIEFGADTNGAKPRFFFAQDYRDAIAPGEFIAYTIDSPRANTAYEFELWTDGFPPDMDFDDAKGIEHGFSPIDRGPKYEYRGFTAPTDGEYKLKIHTEPGKGGAYTLRAWRPLTLQHRR